MMSHVLDWKDECIDMEDDVHLKAEELPGGFTTLWLDVSQRPNRDDDIKVILSKLSQLAEIRNKSVTVLYFPIENSSEEKAAEQECKRTLFRWQFRLATKKSCSTPFPGLKAAFWIVDIKSKRKNQKKPCQSVPRGV